GLTNYKGVCGDNWAWGNIQNTSPIYGNNGLDNGDGAFYRTDGIGGRGSITMGPGGVQDGPSVTFLIGEGLWASNYHNSLAFFNHGTGTCAIPLNNRQSNGTPYPNTDWGNTYSFHSNHAGGGNFAMADASIQFISNDISLTIYRGLATVAGGEVAPLP